MKSIYIGLKVDDFFDVKIANLNIRVNLEDKSISKLETIQSGEIILTSFGQEHLVGYGRAMDNPNVEVPPNHLAYLIDAANSDDYRLFLRGMPVDFWIRFVRNAKRHGLMAIFGKRDDVIEPSFISFKPKEITFEYEGMVDG